MIQGEYKSPEKARDYNANRFKGGLQLVDSDEMRILERWLTAKLPRGQAVVLDLGAGTGRTIKQILKIFPKTIYALDQSPAMLKLLEENYPDKIKEGTIKTIVGSSEKTALPKESINVVVSLHLFKHLKEIKPTLIEINRILKSKGLLMFDVLNINSIIRLNLGTCYALDKSSLVKNLAKNGFTCLEIISLHAFGETVHNVPGAPLIHIIDQSLTRVGIPLGTKFFVLAQKNV